MIGNYCWTDPDTGESYEVYIENDYAGLRHLVDGKRWSETDTAFANEAVRQELFRVISTHHLREAKP